MSTILPARRFPTCSPRPFHRRARRLAAGPLLAALAAVLLMGATAERPTPGSSSTGAAQEVTLANGLRLRMLPDRGSGLVASNVFVGAGSTREEDRFAGSSHFLEHLLFNGTTTHTQEELYAWADRIGAYNNATTRQEYTHYMMVAPNEHLDQALQIQVDMLLRSTLPPDKFEKERGIVLEEMSKDQNSPTSRAAAALDSLLYAGTPFARPVLGTPTTIQQLPRDAVWEYYCRQYVPANMLVLLMGDFDPPQARALVEKLFQEDGSRVSAGAGGSAAQTARAPLPEPALALPTSPRLRSVATAGEQVTMRLAVPLPTPEHPDFAALAVLAGVLGGGESNRLQAAFTREPRLALQEASAGLSYVEGSTLLDIRLAFDPGTPHDQVVERTLGEIARLAAEPVSDVELETVRTRELAGEISQLEQLHYYALQQGDRIWQSPPGFVAQYLETIGHCTAQDLLAAGGRWLKAPAVQVCLAGPGVAAEDRELSLAAAGYATPAAPLDRAVRDPHGKAASAAEMRTPPPALAQIEPPSVTTLPNGLTVIHAAAPTTRMFAMHLLVRDRSGREPAGKEGIADLLHRMLSRGAGPYDAATLAQRLDAIAAELKLVDAAGIPYDDYYTTPLYSFARLGCIDEFYGEAIRLLGLMVTQPRLPESELQLAKDEMLALLKREQGQTSTAARDELGAVLFPGHPLSHRVLGTPESVGSISIEDLRAFAAAYFDPAELVLAVVGNVPKEGVLTRVGEAFAFSGGEGGSSADASASSSDRQGSSPVGALEVTRENVRREVTVGGEQAWLRMGRVMDVDPADRWALQVAALLASGRMAQDLRETRGLAYSLGLSCDVLGGKAAIVARMGTRPANLIEAEAGMLEHLTGGKLAVTEDQIQTAVNSYLGRMRMRRVTRMGQAFALSQDLVFEGGLDAGRVEAEGLARVTPADVQRAAGRYLGAGALVTIIAR